MTDFHSGRGNYAMIGCAGRADLSQEIRLGVLGVLGVLVVRLL